MNPRKAVMKEIGTIIAEDMTNDFKLFRELVERYEGKGRSICIMFMDDDMTQDNYYKSNRIPWHIMYLVVGETRVESKDKIDNPTVVLYITESMLLSLGEKRINPATGKEWDPMTAYWTTPYLWAEGEDTLRDYEILSTIANKYNQYLNNYRPSKLIAKGIIKEVKGWIKK